MLNTEEAKIKLNWLFRIRLVTIFAAGIVFILSLKLLELDLKIAPFLSLFIFGLFSNYIFRIFSKKDHTHYQFLVSSFLILDIAWLTTNLYFYGGHTNPFSVLYLFYITLAAFLLDRKWTWISYLFSLISFGILFFYYIPVEELSMHNNMHDHSAHGHASNSGFSLHLQGMFIGFLLIGAILSFFLSKMAEEIMHAAELSKILKEKQAQESKLLGLASLTAGAAHELSTPIGTIRLITENLIDTYPQNTELLTEISQIDTEVERCEKVLKRMRLKGFELPAEVPSEITVRQIQQQLQKEFASKLDYIQFINFDNDSKFKSLCETLIESLIALIKNALEASKNIPKVILEFAETAQNYEFIIRDSGAGISSEVLTRIGDPFVSTKADGMGLGLFLVKLFAKRVGAELNINSDTKGSAFSLNIPKS